MEDGDADVIMGGDAALSASIAPPSHTNGFLGLHELAEGFRVNSQDAQSFEDEPFEDESGDEGEEGEEGLYDPTDYPDHLRRRGLLPTGCCYDDRMKLHANADFGPTPHHPEDPSRIEEIMKTFKRAGLVYSGPPENLIDIVRTNPTKYMWRIQARPATRDEICEVHSSRHYSWVQELSKKPTSELRRMTKIMDQGRESLYVGSMTYDASLISAGGAIETCKAVINGDVKNAFAVIRPPGHHAEYDKAMGFCLFNNVPIAARICQRDPKANCRKVLILDWDVHHGNGVQNIFYSDPNVLYISIHVYMNGEFYPGKPDNPMEPDGGIDQCGKGAGLGRNVNIGWSEQGMGDGEYMAAFQKIVMPIAHEFDPDLVIISAGFDAAAGDQLGGCFVSPECYAHMTHMLMSLANGKVAVCLEGGYNLEAISKSALAVARTLMGEPPPRLDLPKINRDAARVLARVQAYQAPYWECMRPGIVDVQEAQTQGAERLHDVVRESQRLRLSVKYGMVPLRIQRDVVFKSFENQVLVTPRLSSACRILVILHDPPQLLAQPDPLDSHLDLHNSWVVNDGVDQYIDWAVKQKFGIIDINVPQYITHPEDADSFTPRTDERRLQQEIQEVVTYIWDNYLELTDDAVEIFLIGVGVAYLGIKVLLINKDCKARISGVISFVTGNLRPVKSDVDEDLSSWYKNNSRIYVGHNHACWQDEELTRKVHRKRFGGVKRSPVDGLNRMMREHAEETQRWIMDRVAKAMPDDSTEEEMVS